MADKASAASQEKSGGPQKARASVSLGSAGAGEEKTTHYFDILSCVSELARSSRLNRSEVPASAREGEWSEIARAAGIGEQERLPG
jgi:hypothetical protein